MKTAYFFQLNIFKMNFRIEARIKSKNETRSGENKAEYEITDHLTLSLFSVTELIWRVLIFHLVLCLLLLFRVPLLFEPHTTSRPYTTGTHSPPPLPDL